MSFGVPQKRLKVECLASKGKRVPQRTRLCGIKDSNFHSSRNQILSLARLPIPPMPLAFGKPIRVQRYCFFLEYAREYANFLS